ncbi:hypothetical protein MINTM021_09590 [Mycobacterium paraintracellulare]|nr:hypothetical protein MINTM021_09590 [Mycobacterium paraintracellulare]
MDARQKFGQVHGARTATMVFMTSQTVVAVAKQARSALVSIRSIPGLTAADDAEAKALVAEADQLTDSFCRRNKTPVAERAWLTGLRALVAKGSEIERKYREK